MQPIDRHTYNDTNQPIHKPISAKDTINQPITHPTIQPANQSNTAKQPPLNQPFMQ